MVMRPRYVIFKDTLSSKKNSHPKIMWLLLLLFSFLFSLLYINTQLIIYHKPRTWLISLDNTIINFDLYHDPYTAWIGECDTFTFRKIPSKTMHLNLTIDGKLWNIRVVLKSIKLICHINDLYLLFIPIKWSMAKIHDIMAAVVIQWIEF